mmetsp:Transcript_16603/g.27706  ORF Transcript_16603/g.27706 Transcript_16603/m.27706 type:complete len:323 (+) Transcript_16603:31-999(+)
MEFVNSNDTKALLSRDEFIALDDETKLTYFADQLPAFEKRLLLSMMTSSAATGASVDDEMNVFSCTTKCHYETGFDVTKFQFSIAKLVVKKATAVANVIWTDLFASLSTEQAKLMVKSGIAKMHEQDPNINTESTSLTYGEVDFFSFANILEKSNPQRGETFVDLGHGTGKGLICANLLYGNLLKKCYGVEIIPELYESSVTVLDQFRKNVLCVESDPDNGGSCLYADHRGCEMKVDLGDILADEFIAEWSSADIVFANSTCFEDTLMRQLGDIAGEKMKVGSRFISLTKQLPSSKFKLLDRRQYVMSWGEATCFTMLRLPD